MASEELHTVRLCFPRVGLCLHEAELSCLSKYCLEDQLQCWSLN